MGYYYYEKNLGNVCFKANGNVYTHEFIKDCYGGYEVKIYKHGKGAGFFHMDSFWVSNDPQEVRDFFYDFYDINDANDTLKTFLKGD